MWAFGSGSPKGERLTYRGYALEICKHPVGWRLGISPIRPGLPLLAHRNFTVPYPRKDDALTAARKRDRPLTDRLVMTAMAHRP